MDENLFKKVPVKVQRKSGFDLSFQNLLTTKVGTITPVLCQELMPNESVQLKAAIQAQLPPLASDTFMRCDLKYEAFFVPHRLIMQGFEEWLIPGSTFGQGASNSAITPKVPIITLGIDEVQPGSLADYLGVKANIPLGLPSATTYGIGSGSTIGVNALPFLAYHRIYDDWYRSTLIQKPIYRSDAQGGTNYSYSAMNSKYVIPSDARGYNLNSSVTGSSTLSNTKAYYDGVLCTDLRQRNFGIDRFTSATSSAQNGDAQGLKMTVSNNEAGFSIGQLRAANAIQQWLERNNLAGNRLVDYVKANYGANLSDGVAQRSLLLGSGSFAVYSKGIYQTAPTTENTSDDSQNPFLSVGSTYGSAFASGSETIIDSFTANEPGYLFVMCTLVPKVTYATGIDRKFIRYYNSDRSDMANPMLQGTGNEPIWMTELSVDNAIVQGGLKGNTQIFGYQERFADWKSKEDEIHGLLRERNSVLDDLSSGYTNVSLSSFALQSSFGVGGSQSRPTSSVLPTIGTGFLQIPTTYLDDVAASKGDISKYGCWIDSYFDFKVSMPLAHYSMPTLQDPAYEHGEDIVLDRGGKRIF